MGRNIPLCLLRPEGGKNLDICKGGITMITYCGVALDLLCLLDFDFLLGIHLPHHMYERFLHDIWMTSSH